MIAQPGPCIGQNPTCPCQDGDACHYEDTPTTKGWPVPDDQTGALRHRPDAVDHDRAVHTPGPWIAVKGAAGSHPDVWEIASDRGEHEYEIVGHVSTRRFSTLTRFDEETIEANARLMAAAPKLLKACQQALYALKGREHDGFLRDAIAEALGEST